MRLVVDASVAVKWFVSEPLLENARRLLSHRIDLHAPDFVLVEFANVIWKKVRRKELPASPRYVDALSSLNDIVTLHPVADLIERAMQIAMEIGHPVYDCLYLACAERTEIAGRLERAGAARSKAARTQQRGQAERRLRAFLERLRQFTVLDPACGSGNFLHLALHALKDLEHRVQLEAEAMGLQRAFPAVGPANVRGIEINAYAAELARVSVWIGEIQWMRRNGFNESRDPIPEAAGDHRMP